MKKSFTVFIGIDVSKFKLDVCCCLQMKNREFIMYSKTQ